VIFPPRPPRPLPLQSRKDHLDDRIHLLQHLVVPEPQNLEPSLLQAPVAYVIPLALQMLPAVEFHDQSPFKADEIQHVVEEWMLAAELAARDLAAAQALP